MSNPRIVTPAKAGGSSWNPKRKLKLDSRLRGNDKGGWVQKSLGGAHSITVSNNLAKLIERAKETHSLGNVCEVLGSKPTREEVFARLQSREPVRLSKTAAELIRDERDTN